ncbi:hypothetical protein LUZ63_020267 [Rhynchospora breviuscula]|uniref:Thioredoxin domain-containing protein n=1 Tax=Rhynchospora breviuscula TaxID=2022672 RepID=A0A9Q0C0Z5_9POAL|nr:hypothetical protein LUZ63_020267 [Rhynchospora breviuscula]
MPSYRPAVAHLTLRQALLERGRANSLNLVRLALALLVVVSHSWLVAGRGDGPAPDGFTLGLWAVFGFFSISGFLVTASGLRLPPSAYVRARALRILPGFWVCLVVTALVAAPLAALLGAGSWDPVAAAGYVVANAGTWTFRWTIGTTLAGNPTEGVWNLSLWTLPFELAAYVGVLVVLALGVRRRPRAGAVVVLLLAVAATVLTSGLTGGVVLERGPALASYFSAGMVLLAWGDVVPVSRTLAAAALVGLVGGAFLGPLGALVQPLALAYLVLLVGAVVPARWAQRTDVSYGVYIYAFPVQQLLAAAGLQQAGLPVFVLVSVVGALAAGWMSWTLVERHALRWKPQRPRRLVVLVAAVLLALGLGWWRARRDGRFRGAGEPPAEVAPVGGVLHGTAWQDELGERATLLQFSSAFCAPCRAARRTLGDVAGIVPGVRHVEVDAEQHLDLVRRLGVLRTPTTLVLDRDGREVSRAQGAPTRQAVIASLDPLA